VLASATLLASAAHAELTLPAVIGDHMVLQRGDASLWGWAAPGSTIAVAVAGRSASAHTGQDGRWKVVVPAVPAGGPYEVRVSGDGDLVLRDVLVGETWLGAGQSNMEVTVHATGADQASISVDDCAQLRVFTVEEDTSPVPLDDVRGAWRVCTPEAARSFPAIAYAFARDLRCPVSATEHCSRMRSSIVTPED
jgi:sialate O-acetylesterase